MTTLVIALVLMLTVAGLAGRWASRKQRRLALTHDHPDHTEERHARDHRQRA